jgi:hypothetical protein
MITALGLKLLHFPAADFQRGQALTAPVIDQQISGVILIEALDAGILERGLKQGVQDVETGFVGGEPGALDLHAAERAAPPPSHPARGSTDSPNAPVGSVPWALR